MTTYISRTTFDELWGYISGQFKVKGIRWLRTLVRDDCTTAEAQIFVDANRQDGRYMFMRRMHRRFDLKVDETNPYDFVLSTWAHSIGFICPDCNDEVQVDEGATLEDVHTAIMTHLHSTEHCAGEGCQTCALFHDYFNCADELAGGLKLKELDQDFVIRAGKAPDIWRALPLPPHLASAEELALDMQNGRYRGVHNPYRKAPK